MTENDTIAAIATPPGTGGIAIIRVSGPDAEKILESLFVPAAKISDSFVSHKMYYGHVYDQGEMLDECMAVLMRKPSSYTKEDVAELHLHGGGMTSARVLRALTERGVRPAEPGEFTRRAFLNGRIDLSKAEAVMNLIGANGQTAARAALRQLSGGASSFIKNIQSALLETLAAIEAAIDYPDEVDDMETACSIRETCLRLAGELRRACDIKGAKALENGLSVVLCGAPNAGKSSLLNRLLERERAIVTDIPGTTRDIISDTALIGGIRFDFSDTAGIHKTEETVEKIGIDLARKAVRGADVVLHLIDSSRPLSEEDRMIAEETEKFPHITVFTKADLPWQAGPLPPGAVRISSLTGDGLDTLKQRLLSFAGKQGETELTQLRHMYLAQQAAEALEKAAERCTENIQLDLCSIDLNEALNTLGQITGDSISEELLNTIFSRFCVGK